MDYIRQTVFMAKGFSEFTKGGFQRSSKKFKTNEVVVYMAGKNVLITGANSGIGFETAKALAAEGARIHLVCRDAERGRTALLEIMANSHSGVSPTLSLADLSKPEQIIEFCKKFAGENKALDVLINNAGCMVDKWSLSEIGKLETNFCTNTFAPYAITTKLLPLLKKSKDPRVITVSSGGMYTEKLNVDDFNSHNSTYNSTKVYAQNKRQQVVMTERFAGQHPSVFFATMHPGWADTPAVRTSMPKFYSNLKKYLRSPSEGADTLVWLVKLDNIKKQYPNGMFFFDREPVAKHLCFSRTQSNPGDEDRLMLELETMLRNIEFEMNSNNS
ncbi:hypothetical protein ACOME3_001541 [Neoechinorhynchus agilis]